MKEEGGVLALKARKQSIRFLPGHGRETSWSGEAPRLFRWLTSVHFPSEPEMASGGN